MQSRYRALLQRTVFQWMLFQQVFRNVQIVVVDTNVYAHFGHSQRPRWHHNLGPKWVVRKWSDTRVGLLPYIKCKLSTIITQQRYLFK